ncbi:MAG: hypothetical protein KKF41_02025 [Actinobacteria bacterium]|nr:hypothetical protein [Actinomycetota bacterium]MBU1942350.1 hypothetical protein [Actinomycetota bacterium]MBU2686344.1 hypothetical protein [Actinomycetota bacterium]
MEPEIQPGDVCELRGEVTVADSIAFARGELVTVEEIKLNPQRPEYRYVVYSTMTGKRFQLSDRELKMREKAFAPEYHSAAEPWSSPPIGPGGSADHGLTHTRELEDSIKDMAHRKWVIYLVIAVVLVVGAVVAVRLITAKSGPEGTLHGFFAAAQRNDVPAMMERWDPDALAADPGTREFITTKFTSSASKGTITPGSWNVALSGKMHYKTTAKDDGAVVVITNDEVDGSVSARMVEKDGTWYIAEMTIGP